MNTINLNFINHSNDTGNNVVVIFQNNHAQGQDETVVAWKVIANCGIGDNHPFTFPSQVTVSFNDSFGNFSPQLEAVPGDAFSVEKSSTGDVLTKSKNPAKVPAEIEVTNNLSMGAIDINCYRDGKLLSTCLGIVPAQMGAFQFKPTIYIGAIPQMEEGEIMNAAIVSEINTEISLLGISGADIVMKGGGTGPQAMPFTFTLTNIKYAQ
ncbi:MAG: hypothetical protein V4604_10695 [Bacteroidota bacterium]